MQSLSSAVAAPSSEAPTMADGAAAWSALCRKVRQRAQLDAEIIELAGEVQRSGTIETLEGVPLDTALNLVHRLPAAERGMLLTSADVLRDMPATMTLLKAGTLSPGQVRGNVAEAKRLAKDDRTALDAHIDASADLFDKIDPDDAIDAVRITVEELRGVRKAEQREERVERSNFVWGQPSMFGAGKLYAELDNLSLATVLNGMDAMAPPDDGRPLSQRRADGLVAMASGDAQGGVGTDLVVCVDVGNATATAAGTIQMNAPGCLPTITAKAAEALAQDASVRAVLFDGGRPLAVTKKVWAKSAPADVRLAVKLRDRGDRFPGSRGPVEHVHHLDKTGKGHHVDHLVGLRERSHRRVHRHGWTVTVDPPTAEVTFTHGERTWTTLPRGTRLRRPASRGGVDRHGGGRAPPSGA